MKTMGKGNVVCYKSAIPWYKGEGNKREKVGVHRVIPTYVYVTLCTLTFSLLFPSPLYQGMVLWLLMTLPFPIVLMLHGV